MKRLVIVVLLVGIAGCDPASAPDLDEVRRFDRYPLFYAGEALGDLPLTHAEVLPSHASFVYGDCDPGVGIDAGGCAPPVEVQVWPRRPVAGRIRACDEIRGVPAGVYADRIELFPADVTVVIFGHPRHEAALALRGVNTDVGVEGDLPPPSPGRDVPCPKR